MTVGFFFGDCWDETGFVAVARQANAKVGVFCHVMCVPCAKLIKHFSPEEYRRPAKWYGKAKARNAGQNHAKPARVFDGKATG